MESWSLKGSRAPMESGSATRVRSALTRSGLGPALLKAAGVIPSGTMPLDLTTKTKRLGNRSPRPSAWSWTCRINGESSALPAPRESPLMISRRE